MKGFVFYCVFAISFFQVNAQLDSATETLRNDLKRLLSINAGLNYTTFNNPEGGRIETDATTAQVIEIVPPFLLNNDPVAKRVCWSILGRALLHKPNTPEQRQAIVEILCRHYLESNADLQTIENIILQLHAADFNDSSKKYIRGLFNPGPRLNYKESAIIAAMAQVKELIPELYKLLSLDSNEMSNPDTWILASLARLGEKRAAALLCSIYWLERQKPNPEGAVKQNSVTMSKQMAFAMHPLTLMGLRKDFAEIDFTDKIDKSEGGDFFWWPAQYLGERIASMLKDYPRKSPFSFEPYELREWLKKNPDPVLGEK